MGRLRQQDFPALLEAIQDTYAIRDLDAFPRAVIRAVRGVIPCEYASWAHGFLQGPMTEATEPGPVFEERGIASRFGIFARYAHEHPVSFAPERFPDGCLWRFSNFFTRRQWHRLGLYNEYYRRVGVEYQIGLRLPRSGPGVTVIALNRAPGQADFSDRDLDRLALLAPHLAQAYRNAAALSRAKSELALMRRGLEGFGKVIVLLERGRGPLRPGAGRELLTRYFPEGPGSEAHLPDTLQRWIRHHEELLDRDDAVPPPRRPLVVEREGKRLVIRLLSEPTVTCLLLEEQRAGVDCVALEQFGLTRREAEVLAWVAEGKTSGDIAYILGIRPKTVEKHLEHIFDALGVETRTAAAARAREVGG